MREADGMTYRQYLAAVGVALFSPVSRLLPDAVLRRAGFSGWLAPLAAAPLLLGLTAVHRRLLRSGGETRSLGEALEARLGPVPGKAASALLCLWILFYGGIILRSGGERILATVYPTGRLWVFAGGILVLGAVFALGELRWAGRSAMMTFLFFAAALLAVFAMALPGIHGSAVWPPDPGRSGDILRAAVPVADVLSPWFCFSFLRGRVTEEGNGLPRALRGMLGMLLLVLLFLIATIGALGPELALRQQYPFYVMIKNLRIFGGKERFDALTVAIWMATDYVCVGMLLLSASEGLRSLVSARRRQPFVPVCAGGMLMAAVVSARSAFSFARLSETAVPAVNLSVAFLLLPLISCLPGKNLKKKKNRC